MHMKKRMYTIFVLAVSLCMLAACAPSARESAKEQGSTETWESETESGAVEESEPESVAAEESETESTAVEESEAESGETRETAGVEEAVTDITIETVYQYINYNEWTGEKRDAVIHDTWSGSSFEVPVEDQEAFIKQYLEERGLSYEEQAGSISEEDYDILWFRNEETGLLAFVIWSYFHYYPDGAGEAVQGASVWCTSMLLEDMQEMGRMVRSNLGEGSYQEVFLDLEGEERASMTYTCEEGIPFPVVSAYDAEEGLAWLEPFIFYRNNKFCLNGERVLRDEADRFFGYRGELNIWYGWAGYSCMFVGEYDKKGRLCAMNDIWHEYEAYGDLEREGNEISGGMTFTYRENGSPLKLSYWHSGITGSGTWDSSGRIYYDELGRVAYNSYYVTHGGHYRYYLYENEEEQPWMILEFCSMPYSGDEAGWNYGHEVQAFLFEPFMVQ